MSAEFEAELVRMRENAYPISELAKALEGNWQARNEPMIEALKSAEMVFALPVEPAPGHRPTIFYGKELLSRIQNRGEMLWPDGRWTSMITFIVDWSKTSDEPEILAAACAVVKGRCDW